MSIHHARCDSLECDGDCVKVLSRRSFIFGLGAAAALLAVGVPAFTSASGPVVASPNYAVMWKGFGQLAIGDLKTPVPVGLEPAWVITAVGTTPGSETITCSFQPPGGHA
ncbi:MAG TPA: twin-arginine translocation signal domain-containing protein [Planctomycetota bacterium]|nr:twin-arginine translocation signal domain-containing protein [Planctomycetota bacterium]